MRLANDYESEADIPRINYFSEDLGFLQNNTDNKEVKTLISEIMGFLNCYTGYSIQSNTLKSIESQNDLNNRFNEIMQDTIFLDLSCARNQLNSNRNSDIIPRINLLARKIASSKNYKKYIKMSKILSYIFIPTDYKSKLDLINALISKHHAPSLIDLDDIILKAVYKQITHKEWDEKRMTDDGEAFLTFPWSAYDLPGEPVFKSKDYAGTRIFPNGICSQAHPNLSSSAAMSTIYHTKPL